MVVRGSKLSALLPLALSLSFAAPALCSAASLAELGALHHHLVGEDEVEVRLLAVSPLERGARLEEPGRTAAVQDIFPTVDKERIQALFASAHWDFHPDGTFRVAPALAPVVEELSLEGTYQQLQGAIEVHAARKRGAIGSSVSLDGILRESGGGYRLAAIYNLWMSLTSHWLAEVRQEIRPGVAPPPREPPVTWIDGIPVPSMFEVTLRGQTDGRDLPAATGRITIFPAGEENFGPVAIELDVRALDEQSVGRFFWPLLPAATEPSRARITVRNGTVSVEITPRPGDLVAPFWIAPMPVTSLGLKDLVLIAKWGRLDLTFQGDEVAGQIQAMREGGNRYQGTLAGKRRPLRMPTEPVISGDAVTLSPKESVSADLVGNWRVEDGVGGGKGDLSLTRGEGSVFNGQIGSGGSSRTLAGREEGECLALADPKAGGSFWRFRLLDGKDVLLGFEYSPEHGSFQTLIARRTGRLDENSGEIPSTRAEIVAQLTRGVQLSTQGRCSEAIGFLEGALAGLPRMGREESSSIPAFRLLDFHGADLAARTLAVCDLQVGDYDGFLRHLRQAAESLRPERQVERQAMAESIRSLRERLVGYREELAGFETDVSKLCQDLQAGSAGASSELFAAVAGTSAEVEALGVSFDGRIADLEELRIKLADKNLSARDGTTELRILRQNLQETVRGSFTRIAAASQQIAKQDARFMAARDKLWMSFDLYSVSWQWPDQEPLYTSFLAIFKGSLAAHPEGRLGALQASIGVTLQWSDLALQEGTDPLTYLQDVPLAVHAATQLAVQPENWRARLATDKGKIAALERLQPFFADLTSLLLEEGQTSDALAVSEVARSRAFVDLLTGREEIRQGLEKLSQRGEHGTFPSPTTALPPTLDDLLGIVRQRRSTTVEYSLTGDRLAIWVISPDGKISGGSRPVGRAALQSTIKELHKLLEGHAGEPGTLILPDPVRTRQLLRKLHGLLIEPIPADQLPATADEVLTIIPHQELFGVPFAALEDATGRRLIERHPLVYGTSIATLGAMRRNREGRKRAESPPRLLALVNPAPLPHRTEGGPFPSLDKLENGFSRIAELYPAEGRLVLTRQAATKTALRDHGAEADVLHLVTHAEFVEQDPLASFIALAGADGALRVPEVFRLNLSTDLVVLWACETGRGGLSADGVEGLSRGFTWAGASSLLLSLWEIPDAESLVQMEGFHQFWLRQGFSKARALQKAQVEYNSVYPDQPGLWAGFVLYGEAE